MPFGAEVASVAQVYGDFGEGRFVDLDRNVFLEVREQSIFARAHSILRQLHANRPFGLFERPCSRRRLRCQANEISVPFGDDRVWEHLRDVRDLKGSGAHCLGDAGVLSTFIPRRTHDSEVPREIDGDIGARLSIRRTRPDELTPASGGVGLCGDFKEGVGGSLVRQLDERNAATFRVVVVGDVGVEVPLL